MTGIDQPKGENIMNTLSSKVQRTLKQQRPPTLTQVGVVNEPEQFPDNHQHILRKRKSPSRRYTFEHLTSEIFPTHNRFYPDPLLAVMKSYHLGKFKL